VSRQYRHTLFRVLICIAVNATPFIGNEAGVGTAAPRDGLAYTHGVTPERLAEPRLRTIF
jgi:hypothetical protein